MRLCSSSMLGDGPPLVPTGSPAPFSDVSVRSSTGADCSCTPFTGISFCSSDIVNEPPTQNYAVYAMLSGLTFHVLRFTFHVLRLSISLAAIHRAEQVAHH